MTQLPANTLDLTSVAASSERGGTVLVVDDENISARMLEAVLIREGYRVLVRRDAQQALACLERESPDVILMDILMPGVDGFEACRRLKANPVTRLIPVVLLTALTDSQSRIQGLEAGADDFISKPFNGSELRARIRSLIRLKRYTDDLDTAESVILSLALTVEARDQTTDGHCQRLANYASTLGLALGLTSDEVIALRRGGVLHDIGKVGIPDGILLKPGPLTSNEYEVMKAHTLIGDRLCGELRSLQRVRPIVRHHHEHLDGSGYPDHLRGDGVPLLAQLMGIVDVFDALTTDRPYKPALPPSVAYKELMNEVARGWRSRDLVEAFIRRHQQVSPTGCGPSGA